MVVVLGHLHQSLAEFFQVVVDHEHPLVEERVQVVVVDVEVGVFDLGLVRLLVLELDGLPGGHLVCFVEMGFDLLCHLVLNLLVVPLLRVFFDLFHFLWMLPGDLLHESFLEAEPFYVLKCSVDKL
jgi:hypothetical protein